MISKYVVAGLLGIGLILATFAIFGLKVGFGLCLLLVYEAWTLVNKYEYDTISETIWKLCSRPLIPCLLGMAFGWALGANRLTVYSGSVLAFLLAHLVFQSAMTYQFYSKE